MIPRILFLSIFWLFAAGALAVAAGQSIGDVAADAAAAGTLVVIPPDESPGAEELEEVQIQTFEEQPVRDYRDERVVAVEQNAQAEISAVLGEVNRLDDRGDEPALQREIERIKLDAEITRLTTLLEDAEKQGDHDRADEIWAEIEHLVTLDEPVVGVPQEQPAQ